MYKEDIKLANMARTFSYSQYSNFQVRAILRTKSGKIENHGNIIEYNIKDILPYSFDF